MPFFNVIAKTDDEKKAETGDMFATKLLPMLASAFTGVAGLAQLLFQLLMQLFASNEDRQKADFAQKFDILAKQGISAENFIKYEGLWVSAVLSAYSKATGIQRMHWLRDAAKWAAAGAWGQSKEFVPNEDSSQISQRAQSFYDYISAGDDGGSDTSSIPLPPEEQTIRDQNRFSMGPDTGWDIRPVSGGLRLWGPYSGVPLRGLQLISLNTTPGGPVTALAEIVAAYKQASPTANPLYYTVSFAALQAFDIATGELGLKNIDPLRDKEYMIQRTNAYLQHPPGTPELRYPLYVVCGLLDGLPGYSRDLAFAKRAIVAFITAYARGLALTQQVPPLQKDQEIPSIIGRVIEKISGAQAPAGV